MKKLSALPSPALTSSSRGTRDKGDHVYDRSLHSGRLVIKMIRVSLSSLSFLGKFFQKFGREIFLCLDVRTFCEYFFFFFTFSIITLENDEEKEEEEPRNKHAIETL